MSHLELIALVVKEYDPAIDFFVNVMRFELVEDVASLTNDGRPKRWVVVRPVGGVTGILLARAAAPTSQRASASNLPAESGSSSESMILRFPTSG